MKVYQYPLKALSNEILARPKASKRADLLAQTAAILDAVKKDGDVALQKFTWTFDGIETTQFRVSEAHIQGAEASLSLELKSAIQVAYQNIRLFHARQKVEEPPVETMPGVICWRKSVPVERVGLYIPGGSAPLFSTVLMLGVPAQLAGCREVVLCTPPDKKGAVHPAILYSARLCGIEKIYAIGGAQAIAAMAYGTATIPAVWKIFGPGNTWVTAAKQLVSIEGVAIDLPAGPSEVCVIADGSARAAFVAADLLSQAEHGPDSQVLLITDQAGLIPEVEKALEDQLKTLPRAEIAERALQNSRVILADDLQTAMDWANEYAPEHLILAVSNPEKWASEVVNAGSVFLGHYTPESAGDYASGTNHALPTDGFARGYAGVSLDSFLKKVTFQQITRQGLSLLGPAIQALAEAEGLEAHAKAVTIRLANQ
ncbi:MAG: histidinol dehydrogenase [Saprospiraceae bacterium]|nr:histidinol dehydrogenase [Saprospiraceae bacterium]